MAGLSVQKRMPPVGSCIDLKHELHVGNTTHNHAVPMCGDIWDVRHVGMRAIAHFMIVAESFGNPMHVLLTTTHSKRRCTHTREVHDGLSDDSDSVRHILVVSVRSRGTDIRMPVTVPFS